MDFLRPASKCRTICGKTISPRSGSIGRLTGSVYFFFGLANAYFLLYPPCFRKISRRHTVIIHEVVFFCNRSRMTKCFLAKIVNHSFFVKKRIEPAFTSAKVRKASASCLRGQIYAIFHIQKRSPALLSSLFLWCGKQDWILATRRRSVSAVLKRHRGLIHCGFFKSVSQFAKKEARHFCRAFFYGAGNRT